MYEVGNPVENQTPVDKQGENFDYLYLGFKGKDDP